MSVSMEGVFYAVTSICFLVFLIRAIITDNDTKEIKYLLWAALLMLAMIAVKIQME